MASNTTKYKGIFCIILAAVCFTFMNTFVRLSGDLPSIQKSFFRNFIAFLFAAALLWKERHTFHFQTSNLPYLLMRSIAGTIGILCNFYAVDHLVLSDASMLNKMSPFFAILFSFFLLKERMKFWQMAAVAGAFLGSLLIIKPTFANADLFPSAIGLLGGIGAGLAYTYVRMLGNRGENKAFIVFFFSGFSCLVTLPFLLFQYHPMTLYQLVMLLCAGAVAAGGQFSITSAYVYAPAKEISVYDYSQIIFSAILGFFLFSQIPDGLSILGYCIICLMAVFMFLYNNGYLSKKEYPSKKS